MVVPAIDTNNIATFAWYRQSGCTGITLADCLGSLHSYNQYPEYVDGTIRIFDTGTVSGLPNNYNLVNVRIRTDGYVLAWFAQELTPLADQTIESATSTIVTMSSTKCQIQNYHDSLARDIVTDELAGNVLEVTSGAMNGNKYTIQSNTTTTITLHIKYGDNATTDLSGEALETFKIYSDRGNLIWWGHDSATSGSPTNQSTRLGRALYEIWEQLKANQVGGSGASLDYTDVNYYDYEYTSATYLYAVGDTWGGHTNGGTDKTHQFIVPSGRTVYDITFNCGYAYNTTSYAYPDAYIYYNGTGKLIDTTNVPRDRDSNGFQMRPEITQVEGVASTVRIKITSTSGFTNRVISVGTVILADG